LFEMTGILPIGLASGGPIVAGPARSAAAPAVPAQPDLLGDIIAEKAAAVIAQSRADEVARREAVLASSVDAVLQHHLARECKLPDAETIARHTAVMREFSRWCSKHGVGAMPAKAETLVAYLLARILEKGLSTGAAKEIVAAVQFAHDVSGQYLDGPILKAALDFLAQLDVDEAAAIVEAAADLKLPSTNGGSHD
jgi:hypothetical protein